MVEKQYRTSARHLGAAAATVGGSQGKRVKRTHGMQDADAEAGVASIAGIERSASPSSAQEHPAPGLIRRMHFFGDGRWRQTLAASDERDQSITRLSQAGQGMAGSRLTERQVISGTTDGAEGS